MKMTTNTPGGRSQKIQQRNKEIVQSVYDAIYNQGQTDLVKTVFAANLIQHDPTVANGIEGEMAYLQSKLAQNPRPIFVVKHLLAYGDFVAAHVQVTSTPDNEFSGQAEFDLFRFNQQGLIVEHWATIQDVPATSASGHSMFSTLSPDGPESVTQQQEDENRSLLINALDRLFNERDFSVLDQYWSEEYIQHNPQARNGPAALKAFLEHLPVRSRILYALADGSYVLTFGQGTFPGHDPSNEFVGTAAADLYHMVDGKVAEHWDVLQNVPATSVNGHSMFSSLSQG